MDRGEQIARAAFARLDVAALAIAMGCVCALGLWAATAVLLVKGAPPGVHVGTHLALLANYMPGYSVSWPGSVFGVVYGFLIGAVLGAAVGAVWNLAHHIYLMLMITRNYFAGDL
jgi:hypothetical protein